MGVVESAFQLEQEFVLSFCLEVAAGQVARGDWMVAAVEELRMFGIDGDGSGGCCGCACFGVEEFDVAAATLDFEQVVELGLEALEAAAEVIFVAVQIDEGFGLAEAVEGDGFEVEGVESVEEFGEDFVGFGFEKHPFDVEGDEAGFVGGDALEAPGEIDVFFDSGGLFRGCGGEAGEGGVEE